MHHPVLRIALPRLASQPLKTATYGHKSTREEACTTDGLLRLLNIRCARPTTPGLCVQRHGRIQVDQTGPEALALDP